MMDQNVTSPPLDQSDGDEVIKSIQSGITYRAGLCPPVSSIKNGHRVTKVLCPFILVQSITVPLMAFDFSIEQLEQFDQQSGDHSYEITRIHPT
jgi:hypothetical protein